MSYNHKRERTVRSIDNNGATMAANAIQYVYDESSHLIGEYTASGVPIVEYVWKGDVPLAAIYGPTNATKIYYIITDAQNTPRRLIDSSNNAVVWAWDSTAFGVAPPSVETIKFNLRFPGQYYDEITKQHYNLNRYYNPEIGRYMEADPIGLEGGLNPYAYAGSNPVMNVDPSGLDLLTMSSGDMAGFVGVSNPLSNALFNQSINNFSMNLLGGVTTVARSFTTGEINMAMNVFGNKIDYTLPTVYKGTFFVGQDVPVTPNGNMYFPPTSYRTDFSVAAPQSQSTFIHEMTHVMQYQNDVAVMLRGIPLQIQDRYISDVYNFTYQPNKKFNEYNLEQQGRVAEAIFKKQIPNIILNQNWSY